MEEKTHSTKYWVDTPHIFVPRKDSVQCDRCHLREHNPIHCVFIIDDPAVSRDVKKSRKLSIWKGVLEELEPSKQVAVDPAGPAGYEQAAFDPASPGYDESVRQHITARTVEEYFNAPL